MSTTRIIIEKDGERWEDCDDSVIFSKHPGENRLYLIDRRDKSCIQVYIKPLPPLIRTDNSEVITNLERGIERRNAQIRVLQAENAKLREALKCVVDIANSRIPTVPIDGEFEIMRNAQEIINGINRKEDGISKKGGAE